MKLYALSLVAMLSLIACGQQGSDDSKNPDTSPTDLIVTTPKISGEPDRIVSASSFYEYIPVISDTGEQVEITGTNIPGWLTLDASSGALSGTPGERDVGVYNGIVIKVSNEAAETSFGPFSITVLPEAAKIPLTIEGIPQIELDEGQNYFFKPVVSHEQSTLLTFKIVNKPAALTFNSLNGELSGAFGFDTAGTYPGIVISVEDGTETKSLPAFSITVNNVNRAPTISGTPVSSIMVDEKYRFFPSASDEDGDTLSFSSENFPNWLSVNEITGEVHGTPAVNEIGTYTSLKLIVSDSRDSAVLTFNVTVTETPNNAPTISGTPANSIIEGANYSFVPTFGDADNDTLSFSSENFPAWLNVNALTGEVHGTPAAMNVGSYTNLKLIVSDGRDSAALTFSVNVTAKPNNTPTISGTPPTTVIAGQYYEFIPGANDVDSDPLSFTITNKPLWASFDSITGALSGTPTVN
ncbi:MAG: putative Ig domain-containing protein, partial [Gammaproteobacteria bacterium]|nr:putative Ig domain-containing protein [Gammaproteobacteria bacterium]